MKEPKTNAMHENPTLRITTPDPREASTVRMQTLLFEPEELSAFLHGQLRDLDTNARERIRDRVLAELKPLPSLREAFTANRIIDFIEETIPAGFRVEAAEVCWQAARLTLEIERQELGHITRKKD